MRWIRPLWYFGNNRLSMIGTVLATTSAVTVISFLTTSFFGVELTPYAGIAAFIIFPSLFLLGLFLIPLGMVRRRRRLVREGRLPHEFPAVDLRQPNTRAGILTVIALTGVNVVIFLAAAYRGLHVMDSTEFCGATCHVPMQPEYTAYQASAHARVPCVDCHIGPGAGWFVRSKLSGSWQLIAVTFDLFPRPIPTPVHNLRPSRDTCEQCHWPEMFVGDRLVVRTHFTDAENPVEQKTVLLMHTGGLDPLTGKPLGNHGVHLQPGSSIRYAATDEKRQEITYVRYEKPNGEVVEFFGDDQKDATAPPLDSLRLMDCVDCHNRPAHAFEMPEPAVDRALAAGELDRTLPWIRNRAVALLQQEYASHEAAATGIRNGLREFYQKHYASLFEQRRTTIDAAADVLIGLYRGNVFPEMKVTWGTYPTNLGHDAAPGCLRCHDGSKKSRDGRAIPDDCETCHGVVAMEEENPQVLDLLFGASDEPAEEE